MATTPTLLLQAGVQLVLGALYVWVARIVLDRKLSGDARTANVFFAVWWIGLGLVFLTIPFYTVYVRILGYQDLAFAVTYINILLTLIVSAAGGLVGYLIYLYTGSRRWWGPIAVFYAALAVAFLYLIAWLDPTGFDATGQLAYARGRAPAAASIALGLAYSLPVLLAAIGYGSLLFKVRDPLPRYRIALVAGGFMLQFGWSTLSTVLQLSRKYPDNLALSLFGNLIALLAAVAIVLAFRPPRAVQLRLERAAHGGS